MGQAWARYGSIVIGPKCFWISQQQAGMRILVAHNFYQQPGGEDEVFHSERALLESYGHQVRTFEMRNDDVSGMNRLALFGATIWNRAAAQQLSAAVREHHAEIVHFHNTFPLMSPSVYSAARN